MATAPMSTDPSRLSFAKVAASAGKDNVALASFAKIAASSTAVRDTKPENIAPTRAVAESKPMAAKKESDLADAVKAMHIRDNTPSLVVNGSEQNLGSDLGTKPPSLDGKSITSGTTFALDEKESLRPDDSASVKAAEDDDAFSGRGFIVAGSRIGSEAAARAYRAQFYEAPDRRSIQLMQERQTQALLLLKVDRLDSKLRMIKSKQLVGPSGSTEAFTLFYRQTPDEKLLEALESPKDRIFLLRLEQDVIEFVKDSKEPFIDLPPCNSFCRMLTHKLADYYHMTHQVDAVVGARWWMATLDLSPSKATSETGSEAKEKAQIAKRSMMPIFLLYIPEANIDEDFPERSEKQSILLHVNEFLAKKINLARLHQKLRKVTRCRVPASVSTKDKGSAGMDSKSELWRPGVQQYNGAIPNNYQNQMQAQFVPPPQPFNPAMMNNGNMQQYNNMPPPQFPQQGQPRYQPHSAPITTYATPTQSPQPPQQ
ncbi:hypothetical protein DID88_000994 [Monilinia fructigena]|uniref:R3H domain-containing protein n=1 Tax=Monilinia fructigena TaxID=38457 RepID=A0A395IYS9_9HELO|nr:hypothetical protein DID88_000994 [Monilinia fructigena]